jgi:plasmid stabilization system protein ParE
VAKIIELTAGARADFDESMDWYAERSERAAEGFAIAVEEALAKIVADPERFPLTTRGCRYCNLKRYPFRVVFDQTATHIAVIAIAHAKRRPGYWHWRV